MNSIFQRRPVSLVAAAVALAIGGTATAQDKTANPTATDRPSSLSEVIVTGTRRTDRTVTESAAPIDRLVITLDAYRIEIDNRIGISQQFTVTQADIDALADLAIVGVGGTVQYFTNGFDTKTEGVDLVGTYESSVGPGSLLTTLAYNYNKSTVPSFDPLVITPARIVDIEHYAPNDRVNLNLDYNWDRLLVSLDANYYGSFRNEQDYPGQLFSSKTTVDAEFHTRSRSRSPPVSAAAISSMSIPTSLTGRSVDRRPGRWRAVSAYRRPVRLQRRILLCPGRCEFLRSAFRTELRKVSDI